MDQKEHIESIIQNSVKFAFSNREASAQFIKTHSQEFEDSVINDHIKLYVNDFTLSLGEKSRQAVETLEEMARWKKNSLTAIIMATMLEANPFASKMSFEPASKKPFLVFKKERLLLVICGIFLWI